MLDADMIIRRPFLPEDYQIRQGERLRNVQPHLMLATGNASRGDVFIWRML